MQVGISQIIARDMSLTDFFRQSAEAGYEVVEICMRHQGELTSESPPEQLAQIVAEARANHLKVVSMTLSHCTGNLLDSGPKQQTSIRETEVGLRAAAEMGIECTLHTARVPCNSMSFTMRPTVTVCGPFSRSPKPPSN